MKTIVVMKKDPKQIIFHVKIFKSHLMSKQAKHLRKHDAVN